MNEEELTGTPQVARYFTSALRVLIRGTPRLPSVTEWRDIGSHFYSSII